MNQFANVRGLILAAGRGSRFQSEGGGAFPKVLREALGKPLIGYVISALNGAGVSEIAVIVGFEAGQVRNALGDCVGYAVQDEQHGSGHAVLCAREWFADFDGALVVMCGDSPLFKAESVRRLIEVHINESAAVTLASAELDDPTGYGRIIRDERGEIAGIAEEKCADESQKKIREVNGGAYAFDAKWLSENIGKMQINDAGEYNLTDMVRVAVEQNRKVCAVPFDPIELLGVNNPAQLADVESILRSRG